MTIEGKKQTVSTKLFYEVTKSQAQTGGEPHDPVTTLFIVKRD